LAFDRSLEERQILEEYAVCTLGHYRFRVADLLQ
jgi:hypothetical protein